MEEKNPNFLPQQYEETNKLSINHNYLTEQFEDSEEVIDDIVEENAHSYYDETWKMDIIDFSKEAIFKQKINILDSTKFTLKGNVNFMVCKDGSCLPPEDYKFEIVLNE